MTLQTFIIHGLGGALEAPLSVAGRMVPFWLCELAKLTVPTRRNPD